ncbi:MAG: hypothetical protein HKM95_16250 [Inquilinus sp.]|nr:hypothetical protein [Inquilinus sp.]
MVARYFSREKPRSKILIVDSKDEFSEQALFEYAWFRFYPGMIEWLPAVLTGGPQAVDVDDMTILTDFEAFAGDVVNLIPPQRAGRIARDAGLADASGWCPVDPSTLESTLLPGEFLVGDSISASPMPKSAFAASSQARICAASVRARLIGAQPPRPDYECACWSWIADDQAISVGAHYVVAGGAIERTDPFISDIDEDDAARAASARAADAWYRAITSEMFG